MKSEINEKMKMACEIKDKALSIVEAQISGDISSVDAKELGEVADIAKDMAELMELCAEAEYYNKIVESMKNANDDEKSMYLSKYIPEYRGRFYEDWGRRKDGMDDTRHTIYNPVDDRLRERMYYSTINQTKTDPTASIRDSREGRSGISRKAYMEMNERNVDKVEKDEELKKYTHDLTDDLTEMLSILSPESKAYVKQSLANFVNKM